MTQGLTRVVARAHTNHDDTIALLAPHIGRFETRVQPGQFIEGGHLIGLLYVLQRSLVVEAPPGVSGRVNPTGRPRRYRPVDYGSPLLTLSAASASDGALTLAQDNAEGISLDEDEFIFRAPMDGQFYRAPSPEDPIFKAAGDPVAPGDTLGLVEVMKFFYPVAYEGTQACTFVRYVSDDATPIEAGQAVAVLKR